MNALNCVLYEISKCQQYLLKELNKHIWRIGFRHTSIILHISRWRLSAISEMLKCVFVVDSSHTCSKQTSWLSSVCNYHIRDLCRTRHTLDLETVYAVTNYLVHAKLDYCNSLYLNLPPKQLSRLPLLQNSIARAVTGTRTVEHITPELKCMHWVLAPLVLSIILLNSLPLHLLLNYLIVLSIKTLLFYWIIYF